MRWIFFILILMGKDVFAQCKTYRLTANRDTLNCTDFNNNKQGKWVIRVEELRGEPGFEEEGIYKNNLREGKWRRYSLMGDLIAIENYKWNNKDGMQQYFYMNDLEHEESWRAVDPFKKYDTIDVPDLDNPNKTQRKIIKLDAYSQKHGVWKYYRPGTMSLVKTQTYLFDSLYKPIPDLDKPIAASTPAKDTTEQKPTLLKPKQVLEFDKKNSKKKSIKIRDGSTGN
jgi:antitoxin component YwqK of YwqJK toxin-antitoxin module